MTTLKDRAALARRRSSLIAAAKAVAVPVTSCVQARLSPSHLLEGRSRAELMALVIVLAEAADPAILRAVAEAGDDGRPDLSRTDVMLRTAHQQAQSLKSRGLEVPERLARLERDYYRMLRRQKREAEAADAA